MPLSRSEILYKLVSVLEFATFKLLSVMAWQKFSHSQFKIGLESHTLIHSFTKLIKKMYFFILAKLSSPHYPIQTSNNKKDKNRGEKKKLTKADIGQPSNFKHITHVGWNAQSGFDLTGEDESLKPFLQKAGVSENQLKDRRTRDFIYDFIQNHNVAEVVKKEKIQKTTPPPPVPSRHQVNYLVYLLYHKN